MQRREDKRDAKISRNSLRLAHLTVLAFLSVSPKRFSSRLSSALRRGFTQSVSVILASLRHSGEPDGSPLQGTRRSSRPARSKWGRVPLRGCRSS